VNGALDGARLRPDVLDARWQRHGEGTADERLLLFAWLAVAHHVAGRGGATALDG